MSDYDPSVLAHYGVKGMKWGKRKARDKSSGDGTPGPNRKERRAAKRAAKIADLKGKADKADRHLSVLERQGLDSEFMKSKYGAGIATNTRAADMKYLLLYGKTRQQILTAEKNAAKIDRDHFLADADAVSKGKLTSKQKMVIGAAVAGVVLAGAAGAVVLSNKKEAARLANIKPGENISFKDYWDKMTNTEMSRVSGISKDAFEKMDDTPMHIPSGTIFKRVSTDKEEVLRDSVYAAFKDDDVNRYKAALPKFWDRWGIGGKGGYVVSMEAKEAIVSPSQKKRVQSLIDLMDKPVTGQETSTLMGMVFKGDTKTMLGREWLDPDGTLKGKSAEEVALAKYGEFASGWITDSPLKGAFFSKMKEQGFNALVDDNDAGKLSDTPMLIFDTAKSMRRVGATPLSEIDIKKARESIVELTKRG